MDWLTPVAWAVVEQASNRMQVFLENRKWEIESGRCSHNLHKFYEEMEAVEELLYPEELENFMDASKTIEDFLCICKPEEGLEVQVLLTLAMSAFISRIDSDNISGDSAHYFLINESDKKISEYIHKAAKTKAQLNFVLPAYHRFIKILSKDYKNIYLMNTPHFSS
jgi:hypothetical protein